MYGCFLTHQFVCCKNLILFTLNLTPSSRTTNPCVGIKSPSAWVPLASVMVNWTDTVPNVPSSGFRTTYRLATLSLSPDREVGSLNRKCLVVLNEITPCPSSLASIVTVAIRKEISSIILIKSGTQAHLRASKILIYRTWWCHHVTKPPTTSWLKWPVFSIYAPITCYENHFKLTTRTSHLYSQTLIYYDAITSPSKSLSTGTMFFLHMSALSTSIYQQHKQTKQYCNMDMYWFISY